MATVCRYSFIFSSNHPQIHFRQKVLPTFFIFPKYPHNPIKFTKLPLTHHHPFATTSSSSLKMETPPNDYRRNVGICLINSSKKIFSASRLDIPDAWQMPQGGIDEGEDPRAAAIRELREETGVTSAEILMEDPHWLTYDFPPHVREKLKIQWGSDWKGQAQKWFLFKFTGKDEEINLLGDGSEKPEFGEWSWMSPEQVVDRAVDFKKPVYREADAHLFERRKSSGICGRDAILAKTTMGYVLKGYLEEIATLRNLDQIRMGIKFTFHSF